MSDLVNSTRIEQIMGADGADGLEAALPYIAYAKCAMDPLGASITINVLITALRDAQAEIEASIQTEQSSNDAARKVIAGLRAELAAERAKVEAVEAVLNWYPPDNVESASLADLHRQVRRALTGGEDR